MSSNPDSFMEWLIGLMMSMVCMATWFGSRTYDVHDVHHIVKWVSQSLKLKSVTVQLKYTFAMKKMWKYR